MTLSKVDISNDSDKINVFFMLTMLHHSYDFDNLYSLRMHFLNREICQLHKEFHEL